MAGKCEINKGQPERRVLRSRAATSEEVEFPCVEQVALLRRHLRQNSPETVALVTSLPPSELNAAQWLADNRAAWASKAACTSAWTFRTATTCAECAFPRLCA